MKFKTKIIVSNTVILISVLILLIFNFSSLIGSLGHIRFVRDGVSVSMKDMNQIKSDVIKIQQYFLMISFTGDLDEFSEVEKLYADANSLLDKEIQLKSKAGKDKILKQLEIVKIQLQDYYEAGNQMTHQYLKNNREAGNVWIEKFDQNSIILTGLIDQQLEIRNSTFKLKVGQLFDYQNNIIRMLIFVSIFIGVAVILMGVYVLISFNTGIKLISKYSSSLADNNIKDSTEIKRKDEFGVSALQFKNSFKILNILISKIKLSTNVTSKIKDSLAASAEETSATIININNSAVSLLKESEKMDINVSDNVTSVEEITANINSIKDQINEQVAMVEESTAAITEMISSLHSVDNITRKKAESVLRLVAAINSGNDASAATDVKFQVDVIDKIDGISGMAESIQAIAAQTNLLSMNAAIEAAHAGDAGKGFAVVADEIRKLADTSSKSSTSITKIIKEISDGIAGTGEVAQKKVDAFVIMNKEIIETKNAFDEIVTSVQELNAGGSQIQEAMVVLQDVSSSIKNAAAEMTVGAGQVMKSQLELKDISHKVNSGMQEISSGSEEIVIASDEIVKYSSELNSVVNNLKEETDKFIT